jgi:hypothetical protein
MYKFINNVAVDFHDFALQSLILCSRTTLFRTFQCKNSKSCRNRQAALAKFFGYFEQKELYFAGEVWVKRVALRW